MKNQTLIIIPAFNEENSLEAVIFKIKENGFKNILVIDDGSKDLTSQIAKNLKVEVLQHILNRGTGAATQTGIDYGIKQKFKYFLTIDADGQQDANDLQKLFLELNSGANCVLGSRFLQKNEIPLFRKIANKIANVITGIFFNVWVTDSQSGLRGFTYVLAKKLNLDSDGFEFCSEFVREVNALGFEIVEVPISVQYTAYSLKKGQNFAEGMKTFLKLFLKAILR